MIKVFLTFFLLFSCVNAKNDIDKKIKKTSANLKNFSKSYGSINKKMARNAKDILRQKQEILKQQKYLIELKKSLNLKAQSYGENSKKLKQLQTKQQELQNAQDAIEEELIFTIAKSISLKVVLDENNAQTEESLIELEVIKAMLAKTKAKAKKLNDEFYKNSLVLKRTDEQTHSLEKSISSIDTKRKNLLQTQRKNKKSLKKLVLLEKAYKKALKKLIKKQDSIKQTLAKLKIIKVDRLRKARQDEARRKAFAKKTSNKNLPKVKKPGSSYQSVKTKKYRGRKTIAPLNAYTITKKYGTYTDPIYGIKIFNESISMKPKNKNAKVKTVFNGKVIYADKTAILNNIVIVQHKNGLHTIYANLSQISPSIKKGIKIKKGYTIGRVNNELIFEVTQKSYHINPIRLFK